MFAENIALLRNLNALTQEQVAEEIGISRQAYAKWESGETVPDIDKCGKLASFYGVSLDALVRRTEKTDFGTLPPAPTGKHLYGTVTVGNRGQIVIPKEARDTFLLTDGSKLVILGDEAEGIALVKAEIFEERIKEALHLGLKHSTEF